MQLGFEMTGGYAGVFAAKPLSYRVVVDDLPEPDRGRLRQSVDASGLLQAAPGEPGPPPRPDVMTYTLTITTEGRTRRFTFDDITVPPAVRPLLEELQRRAIAERAGGT